MKYIVAVSGGVDSVVLLDMLGKIPGHELVVAHFDHGIREDSARDAQFVASLAHERGLIYAGKREELGANASEALARERRYGFLRELAKPTTLKLSLPITLMILLKPWLLIYREAPVGEVLLCLILIFLGR